MDIDDMIKYNKVKDLCYCLISCAYFDKKSSNAKKIVNTFDLLFNNNPFVLQFHANHHH